MSHFHTSLRGELWWSTSSSTANNVELNAPQLHSSSKRAKWLDTSSWNSCITSPSRSLSRLSHALLSLLVFNLEFWISPKPPEDGGQITLGFPQHFTAEVNNPWLSTAVAWPYPRWIAIQRQHFPLIQWLLVNDISSKFSIGFYS